MREDELFSRTISMDWEGGRLGDLVATIKKKRRCNVVLGDPSTADVVIPALSVSLAEPQVFFKMLQHLPLGGDFRLMVDVVEPSAPKADASAPLANDTLPVVVIRAERTSMVETSQRVFDLRADAARGASSVTELVQAIEFAMKADGRADLVKVRYHEPSKLLFVKAPSDSMPLIGEIVETMRK
jgi:hypothetical protein